MSAFDHILAQENAIDTILRAYRAERLPHGLIFAGPAGVGKATTARALAKLFLCEKPKNDTPCNACESCAIFDANNHPDYHVVTKELIRYHDKTGKSKGIDLSIHVIRPELIDPANRKANLNVGKVFVVEQAELMNAPAQNAMLKTLEEPQGRTLIILLTDSPGSLLQTIRSRCQTIRFGALPEEIVSRELARRKINETVAADAAHFAEGSLGLALKWIDEGVIDRARDLREKIDRLVAGQGAPDLQDWYKKAADAYAEKQLERDELASKDQATREGLSLYLRIASQQFRSRLAQLADPGELERTCAAIDAIARAESYLDGNVNIPLVFQQLTLTLEKQFA